MRFISSRRPPSPAPRNPRNPRTPRTRRTRRTRRTPRSLPRLSSLPALAALPVLTGAGLLPGLPGGPDGLAAQEAGEAVRIVAEPARLDLRVGERAAISVRAVDADGEILDVQVRLVGPRDALRVRGGEVEALAAGDHQLIATAVLPAEAGRAGGATPTLRIPVRVRWPSVTRVDIEREPGRLYVGTSLGHRADAFHGDGTVRPDAPVHWATSDPEVATVDPFGEVTAHAPGSVVITADVAGVRSSVSHDVAPFPATSLRLEVGRESARTGDVVVFRAVAVDDGGRPVEDLPVTWTHTVRARDFEHHASSAGGQIEARAQEGRFVADAPGLHTVLASAGPLSARANLRIEERDVVRELELGGVGRQSAIRTTDFWVFEGRDGRDYAITGSKRADGHAYVFDVTDPGAIVKTDSIQVDARAVNDVKASPDGRYATVTREGASNRRNGVVILDLADPAHPVVAAEFTDGLTGGVHNAFPTESHVFALSNGDKYVIIDVADIYAPRVVGEYDHPDSRVHDVWVRDGLAFSAEWGTGLVVTDVGNGRWGGSPENPVLVSTYALPTGRTHAAFPYFQEETGKYYVFVGDEIMSRDGLAWGGYPRSMGSYADQYDPEAGVGGIPLTTRGYVQVIDFTDPESPEMVARYEVPEYGTHNIWVEDDRLYQAYYEGGLRVVDVSGELMGNLYTQGREIAVFKPADPDGYVPNSPMVWSAMPHKGWIFFSDTNSGLWSVRLVEPEVPVS